MSNKKDIEQKLISAIAYQNNLINKISSVQSNIQADFNTYKKLLINENNEIKKEIVNQEIQEMKIQNNIDDNK